ncbi:S-adenosylmethionine--2-demethylmenaquinone methyltransferase [Pseudomonas daroniae]|uniref:Putative 4-hydroxy-4-methyl-2-oxoglutarate aldolase n=1 Tax=Phytopseudomonas daroniae TaxID=2487519 RepID=A0A4V2KAM3_9GAMM|nr:MULTISPECIES: RraA family protein [Pseudomonas]TBU77906.1 S-adenosylmethionine--2-demethylmenaquinone methyltransferase [Pseudomonas daroniae]TBU82254.1 S-adenosylmethionine--2-demethylmenaquinone methyltransferase [Pseudomonas sp. FRB 228]TBU91119.1 S-adenosylmethionine--2-demethylmenaquinone methyltransferase [Pseudomonas daroniae]
MTFAAPTETIPAALIDAYRGIAASTIGHLLREGHIRGLSPLVGDVHIVGRVTTAQIHAPDGSVLRDALIASHPGDVLVVANRGEQGCACWGELRTLAAKIKGLAGVVIDGPVTDIRALRALGLPIFCDGVSAYTTRSIGEHGAVNVSVTLRGVSVQPGNLLIADDDGIYVLEAQQASQLLPRLQNKEAADASRRAELQARLLAERL